MIFEEFLLERWLPTHQAEFNLAGALNHHLKLAEVIGKLNLEMEMLYGNTQGSVELRRLISRLFAGAHENMVLVTTGTAEANFILMSHLIREGNEVVLFLPTYLQNAGIVKAKGGIVTYCNLKEDEGYKPDIDSLERIVSNRTKAIHLTNPNNPTGSKLSPKELERICNIADRVGAYVIADEALRGLEVDDTPITSPVEFYERGMATGSLSKIGLSGIRIGWIVGDPQMIEKCWALKDYTTLSHSGISELFAIEALQDENIKKFQLRAQAIIKDHLNIIEPWIEKQRPYLSWVKPVAGNTAFPKYEFEMDSVSFCKDLMEKESVLLSPGDYFGFPKHFRIRYGCKKETLMHGLDRFDHYLKQVGKG